MYSIRSYRLTKDEYNYLLPAIGRSKLFYNGYSDQYFLVVDSDGLEDALNRLKGLYNYFHELPVMLDYKCFKGVSLNLFRKCVSS